MGRQLSGWALNRAIARAQGWKMRRSPDSDRSYWPDRFWWELIDPNYVRRDGQVGALLLATVLARGEGDAWRHVWADSGLDWSHEIDDALSLCIDLSCERRQSIVLRFDCGGSDPWAAVMVGQDGKTAGQATGKTPAEALARLVLSVLQRGGEEK